MSVFCRGINHKLDSTGSCVKCHFTLFDKEQQKWQENGGTKYDQNKIRLELLPIESLEEVSKVLTHGAIKYQPWNWTKGFKYSRLIGASMRHLFAWIRGEDKDPETGFSHLAHATCCLLFLLWHEKFRPDLDDRFKQKQDAKKEL